MHDTLSPVHGGSEGHRSGRRRFAAPGARRRDSNGRGRRAAWWRGVEGVVPPRWREWRTVRSSRSRRPQTSTAVANRAKANHLTGLGGAATLRAHSRAATVAPHSLWSRLSASLPGSSPVLLRSAARALGMSLLCRDGARMEHRPSPDCVIADAGFSSWRRSGAWADTDRSSSGAGRSRW